ncbi:MAG TPA: DUF2306 domain-containing protein [Lysobacter sp.]|nr:DUF2306 domain-containing protein [Lysobacter sp.]
MAGPRVLKTPGGGLERAAAVWLGAMLLAQWAFFYYIAAFYGASVASGDLEMWNRLAAFGRRPYVAGDDVGNAAYASHALGAGIIALGGALQLMPWIRARFPTFHRWNGRLFLVTVVVLSLSGFYLVWVRGTSPTRLDALGTSLNGVLILAFAAAAYLAARRRDFGVHREWAMRLYLVSNGQWFLRVGVFAYFASAKAAGYPVSFSDPFFAFWKFGCFLVPLALLELYFRARRSGSGGFRTLTSGVLLAATLAMVLGTVVFGVFCQKLITGAPLSLGG